MKLKRPRQIRVCPTCKADVTHTRNAVRCINVLVNGCDHVFCIATCWPAHNEQHQKEWNALSEVQRAAYEARYPNAVQASEPDS